LIFGVLTPFVHYKTGCTRLAAACDKVYQLLAHGWWFSPGTLASSTTKTGRHDIAESGVKTQKIDQNLTSNDIPTLSLVAASRVHPFL
jgi:hypothetical protein